MRNQHQLIASAVLSVALASFCRSGCSIHHFDGSIHDFGCSIHDFCCSIHDFDGSIHGWLFYPRP
ncbi:hypothetical protein LAV72_14645 [Lysinibacillus xylanilyticus]|uniref:hypothetical protein n=1 Tax=Lysinibacillus xylanilyticus TaxID=582475 RepID=UPI002B2479ED|nr:hypothetical protein [Lysinibacillus xylanilyticus]MEB2300856.1 hypothetical protein [Lysinibacillus xylanilyticus]